MNTVPGTVGDDDTGATGRLAAYPGSIRTDAAVRRGNGEPVVVGIRPEHLVVDPDGAVKVEVRAVEWLGHERLVVCDLAGHAVTVRQASSAAPVDPGDALALTVAPEHVLLFDPESTERI